MDSFKASLGDCVLALSRCWKSRCRKNAAYFTRQISWGGAKMLRKSFPLCSCSMSWCTGFQSRWCRFLVAGKHRRGTWCCISWRCSQHYPCFPGPCRYWWMWSDPFVPYYHQSNTFDCICSSTQSSWPLCVQLSCGTQYCLLCAPRASELSVGTLETKP